MSYARRWWHWGALLGLTVMLCLGSSAADEPSAESENVIVQKSPVTVEVARDRARLMHDIYAATLEVMHHRYFHGARAMVPARALEDVFAELESNSDISARWISVNTKAMSLNHEPTSDFEKKAATEIGAGKTHVEAIEDGVYRRAAAIALGTNCVSCHTGLFAQAPKSPRFAGLVISIPVQQ